MSLVITWKAADDKLRVTNAFGLDLETPTCRFSAWTGLRHTTRTCHRVASPQKPYEGSPEAGRQENQKGQKLALGRLTGEKQTHSSCTKMRKSQSLAKATRVRKTREFKSPASNGGGGGAEPLVPKLRSNHRHGTHRF